MAVEFEGVNPIFCVSDLESSVDYYVRVLGFRLNWSAGGIASVARGRTDIFLCERGQGHVGTWIWIAVSDTDELLEEYRASGAKIRHPPTNYAWAYEMQVEDLDGNVLRLGCEPKDDQPFGEFLDMNGVRWIRKAESGWSRVD